MIKNKNNVRKFTGKVRSTDNVNIAKEKAAKIMDFLTQLGASQYQDYVKSVKSSKSFNQEEIDKQLEELDTNSYLAGSAVFHELLLQHNQGTFAQTITDQLVYYMKDYNGEYERYKVLVDYFTQHGKTEFLKSPIQKDLDTESFLRGFIFAGSNIYRGVVTYELTKIKEHYNTFIKLADKLINNK